MISLDQVLVLTLRKSFWASPECEMFPNRLYTRIVIGYSQNILNSMLIALRGLYYVYKEKPKLILFGSTPRIVPWFTNLKRFRLLKGVKLIATNQVCFVDNQARYLEKIITYSRSEIKLHRHSS